MRRRDGNDREEEGAEPEPESAPYDFKIGLDYYGEISAPTMAHNKEFAWVEYGSQESIDKAIEAVGVRKVHKLSVAKEIASSAPPFWTPSYTGWLPLPIEKTWSQVPMLTNMFTGVAPVTVHHKSMHKGEQKQLNSTWQDTWFYPHLRPMLTAKGSTVRRPIAVVNGPNGREEWWNPHEEIAGLRFEDGGMPGVWRVWEDVCNDEQMSKELFADGQGRWRQPVYVPDDKGQAHEVLHRWMQMTDGKLLHDVI
ncbi:hypothetical protein Micbo1qcDRAFT_166949 [Microdochium bolleyi]|uniref:Uncharacterized protein n=1 Tax=Microdochium bolleyi TaxID=196109 RepID=A0A136IU18_9PEZI|nr:hypothetical protein Micbo1qcDRAFT_166949 [Microdochium bolleyi]